MKMPIRWSLEKPVCDAYEVKGGTSTELHGHHHFLITLITRGKGTQLLNGEEIEFMPNDVFILSPADFHKNTLADGENYDYFGVKFPYELLDERLAQFSSIESFPIHIRLSDDVAAIMCSIFRQLIDESQNGKSRIANGVYMQSLVEQIFILAMRQFTPKVPNDAPGEFINRTLGYLYTNFCKRITVADVARYVGYTPNYFNSKFRVLMGETFSSYLYNMKLKYAKNLLHSGDMSATQIAYEVGFCSLSHFSRSFSRLYGVSPQKYKKSIMQKNISIGEIENEKLAKSKSSHCNR